MSRLLTILGLLFYASTSFAQCGETRLFVYNGGFTGSRIVLDRYGDAVVRTGISGITCADGLCYVPTDYATLVIPQSTAFFALSNPNSFKFRSRDLLAVPGASQIVTVDGFGREVIINAGVYGPTGVRSRGTIIFRHD